MVPGSDRLYIDSLFSLSTDTLPDNLFILTDKMLSVSVPDNEADSTCKSPA